MTHFHNHLSYVTYMPFDVTWSHYPTYMLKYFNRTQEISTMQFALSQEPVQTSCLYTAKQHDLDWIITTDVDEFIYLPRHQKNESQNDPPSQHLPPLKKFLASHSKNEYGCMAMNSIPFGANTIVKNSSYPDEYMIDKVWRKDTNLSDYPFGRYKQFINVDHVWSLGVHYCWMVDTGFKKVSLDPDKDQIYLQHYKQAHRDVSARGESSMLRSANQLRKDTLLSDAYRGDLDKAMKELAS